MGTTNIDKGQEEVKVDKGQEEVEVVGTDKDAEEVVGTDKVEVGTDNVQLGSVDKGKEKVEVVRTENEIVAVQIVGKDDSNTNIEEQSSKVENSGNTSVKRYKTVALKPKSC